MKESFNTFLKLFFVIASVALVVLMIVGIVLIFSWPWWVGIFLVLFVAGLVAGAIFLRKILIRRREQNFVSDMGEHDLAALKALSENEKNDLRDLHDRWKSAIETLRNSHLKKLGNPLYVLPWYMVIGESGSGKTTSLNSARLASPLRDISRVQGVSGTKQCEWWFFEQSVVIDTAGRYAMPVNEGQDKDEWRKFLSMLLKYRRKEPLNGLIVTIAADRLLDAATEELEKDGATIRQRIDELMRALGVKFPVYVLVTKCDLIQGVNRFCQHLPEKSLDQPMGFINQELSPDVDGFVTSALGTIDERLRNLRLHLLHQPEAKGADPALLLFPEEFESLKQGLATFMASAFRPNPYQETPLLRGLFFSSGRQEGNPHSHFSKTMGLTGTEEALPGTHNGLFLHDFFAKILPRDRALLAPTRRHIEWQALTGNLGLTSWVILGIALCCLLSFSFVKNMKTIRDFSNGTSKTVALTGNTLADLASMERFRQDIIRVEEQNRHWWFPRFGLNESLMVEARLKERFCAQFQTSILTPFDKQMATALTGVTPATPDESYGQFMVHLVRRINILKARLNEKDLKALLAKPQPSYVTFLNSVPPGITPDAKNEFGTLYLSSLIWKTSTGEISREVDTLQSWLKQMIAVKGANFQWMSNWVDKQSGLPSVTLKDFWGGSVSAGEEKMVNPSFTRKGKQSIDSLFNELEAALQDSGSISTQKTAFGAWYRDASFASWHSFAAGFSRGEQRVRGAGEYQQMVSRMASDKGPYFELFDKIGVELEPLAAGSAIPAWLQQVYKLQAGRVQGVVQENGSIKKVAEGGAKILTSLRKNVGQEAGAQQLESQMTTSRAWQEYRAALTALAPATVSKPQAFQICSQTFGDDPVTSKSPVFAAHNAANKIKTSTSNGAPDPVFAQLVSGPSVFLWSYLLKEGAGQLQAQWEEQVLAATAGMPESQAIPVILGPEGLAWRFVKGPAAPFLTRVVSGYRPKEVLGGKIAFNASLFNFMSKGARTQAAVAANGKPQNFNIGISGLPTDANSDAKTKPHSTRLEVQCGGNSQTLVNSNYPVGKTFNWSPDTCSDVILQIEIGDKVLTRHYMGQQGFPDFLKDMRGGRRTFSTREFPGEKTSLDNMGVKSITVNYQFTGSGAVLQHIATLSGHAPRSIAR
ncbi:MAG: type VI secretion system protein ImpL [Desulfuromonadales bacterium]|nr:type VI secretion system protein ImpL [Desulfuromonadales bacterium]